MANPIVDSKRLATLKALCNHLKGEMAPGNTEYKHELDQGKGVQRGRLFYDKEDPLPMLSILENIEPDRAPRRAGDDDMIAASIDSSQWILLVQGWTKDDKENPTDPAYELMADVKKALAKLNQGPDQFGRPGHPNAKLGGLITGISMEPGTARPPQDELSSKAFFWMRIVLQFVEDPNDPYKH